MGKIIPMIPSLAPTVDALLKRQRIERRRRNFRRHGLPVLAGTLVLGAAIGFGIDSHNKNADAQNTQPAAPTDLDCGVAIVQRGDGPLKVMDRAVHNAQVSGPIDNYDEGVDRLQEIAPTPYPGQRFRVLFQGNKVMPGSIAQITELADNCAEITPFTDVSQQ